MRKHKGIRLGLMGALLVGCILAGCTGDREVREEEPEEYTVLHVLTMGNETDCGIEQFYEQLDELTKRDLGCIVRFTYIPWGNEKQEIDSAIASGDYDIYCNGVFSNYLDKASKNAFLDLNLYLDAVPELVERYGQLSEHVLQECEIDGKLYGFPEIKRATSIRDGIFLYREDLCEEWGVDTIRSLEGMEEYMYLAKNSGYGELPLITDNRIWECLYLILGGKQYLDITSIQDMPYAVIDIENPDTVICRMETEAFLETLKYVQKWYQDGIIDPNILGVTDNEGYRAIRMLSADEKPCETNSTLNAVGIYYIPEMHAAHPEWKWNFYCYCADNPVYRLSLAYDTCTSVSSRCMYPELAVKFISLAHTDREYYDLLVYGVEGMNYELTDGMIDYSNISVSDRHNSWTGLPDIFMEYPQKTEDAYWDDRVREFEESFRHREEVQKDHPLIGVTMDRGGMDTAELDKVWDTYMKPLLCGVTEDLERDYKIAMDKLYEAGLSEYLQTVQERITRWSIRGR